MERLDLASRSRHLHRQWCGALRQSVWGGRFAVMTDATVSIVRCEQPATPTSLLFIANEPSRVAWVPDGHLAPRAMRSSGWDALVQEQAAFRS